jgi:hypothetical protein
MAGKPRFTLEEVISAIEHSRGLLSHAARRLGCTYRALCLYAQRSPRVREALETQRGLLLDYCELQLYAAIRRGEAWAVCLCLRTLGRARGYVVRQETTTLREEEGLAGLLREVHQHGKR